MMLHGIISGDLAVYATDKTNAAHFALLIKFLISSWSRHRQANDDDFVVGRNVQVSRLMDLRYRNED